MNGIPFPIERSQSAMLTGGAFGLRSPRIQDTMSAYFTLRREPFRDGEAWRLEQRSGPELLPFAVHHRKIRHALRYARQMAGLVRCVVDLEGRHRVVCPAQGVPESAPHDRSEHEGAGRAG